jgi:hypothetical protein
MLNCDIINQKDKLIRGASFKAWSLSSGLHLIRGELRSISCRWEKIHIQLPEISVVMNPDKICDELTGYHGTAFLNRNCLII